MTPHALRRRMAHGNIYPPEKIDAALGNYFREGNLGALRELALLWMADRVDESLHEYMQAHEHRGSVGDAGARARRRDRAPRGGRAADPPCRADGDPAWRRPRSPCTWCPRTASPTSTRSPTRGTSCSALGGTFREVVGASVPDALLDVARAENVTQVVLGASDRSRFTELVAGLGDQPGDPAVRPDRRARDLERARPQAGERRGAAGCSAGLPAADSSRGSRSALVGLPLLTAGARLGSRDSLGLPADVLLYLTLVVAIGAVGGIWPAVATRGRGLAPAQLVLHAADPHVDDRRGREPARPDRLRGASPSW